jgi:hypothetical protein
MILYKYYGFNSGLAALKSGRLGFRQPAFFNDPFELTFFSNASGPDSKLSQLQTNTEQLKKSVAILALTRTPLNSLMWAHYGQEHTGFVIGYDVSDSFLSSREYNLIPVDAGDVVYTYTKNPHLLNIESMDQFHQIYLAGQGVEPDEQRCVEVENLIRKLFLTKHASWVYEEEVRVVKILQSLCETCEDYQSDPLRSFEKITRMVAPQCGLSLVEGLYIYRTPANIKEVYLGVRNPLIYGSSSHESLVIDSSLTTKANNESWVVFKLTMDTSSWALKSAPAEPECLDIKAKGRGLLNSFSFTSKEAEYLASKLSKISLSEADSLELTNWNGECFLKLNDSFLEN